MAVGQGLQSDSPAKRVRILTTGPEVTEPMETLNHKLVEIALDHIGGTDFEQFFQAFYPTVGASSLSL